MFDISDIIFKKKEDAERILKEKFPNSDIEINIAPNGKTEIQIDETSISINTKIKEI